MIVLCTANKKILTKYVGWHISPSALVGMQKPIFPVFRRAQHWSELQSFCV